MSTGQPDRSEGIVRALGSDDDEARFEERVKKLVKRKWVEKPE